MRKSKVGRNKPCPCGSGKKYKKCCYITQSSSFEDRLHKVVKQKQTELLALEMQRKQQQGLGKPIISAQLGDKRLVAVGNKLIPGNYKTFHDFLSDYIKQLFGSQWGNSELAKPIENRHPLLKIYDLVCRQQNKLAGHKDENGIFTGSMVGAISFYLGLSYNLYLIEHNKSLQSLLLHRLKNEDQFSSACYETLVAAIFIKAGFHIEFEDEVSREKRHCEFIATHIDTGIKYGVEAKQRKRKSIISKNGSGKYEIDYDKLGQLLNDALKKDTSFRRVIFLDLNLPSNALAGYTYDALRHSLVNFIKSKEKQFSDAPPAYVFLTNSPLHHHGDLESVSHYDFTFLEGFKISDFSFKVTSLRQAIEARENHKPIDFLFESIKGYAKLPSTFDGSIPEFAFGDTSMRLKIGGNYKVPNQAGKLVDGVLIDCTVSQVGKKAHGLCQTDEGVFLISFELSDDELSAYAQHPDTFFGVYKKAPKQLKTPLETYDFFYNSLQSLSRNELISRLISHFSISKLEDMSQAQLLSLYCEGLVINSYMQRKKGRFWQIDKGGYLLNDASPEQIEDVYNLPLDRLKQLIVDELKDGCHSIYLTGSIPRGLATIGQSDLDIFVILKEGFDTETPISALKKKCLGALKKHHFLEIINKIDIELWCFNDVFPNQKNSDVYIAPNTLSQYHAILKNSSLCIYGENVILELPGIKPDLALANDELIHLNDDIFEAIKNIKENADSENVRYWCRRVMKNIVRAVFCLIMPLLGKFTRDIELCADEAIKYYPNMAVQIQRAKDFTFYPSDNAEQVLDFLNNFGQRLLLEVNVWMDCHNPSRKRELLLTESIDKNKKYYLPEKL